MPQGWYYVTTDNGMGVGPFYLSSAQAIVNVNHVASLLRCKYGSNRSISVFVDVGQGWVPVPFSG